MHTCIALHTQYIHAKVAGFKSVYAYTHLQWFHQHRQHNTSFKQLTIPVL